MSRTADTGLQQAFLHDALIDLAAAADNQAACASSFDGAAASCELFLLADQLRAMAHHVTTDSTLLPCGLAQTGQPLEAVPVAHRAARG